MWAISSYKTVRRTGTLPDDGNKIRGTNHRVTSVKVALEAIETLRYPGEGLHRGSLIRLTAAVKIIDPGTIVEAENYSEYLPQKIVRATELGFSDTCVYGISV
jgi:hypothetical protein